MTAARRTVWVSAAGAVAELGLFAAGVRDWAGVGPTLAAVVWVLAGPYLFLAVLAWRRRAHPTRPRVLFRAAVVTVVVGLGGLGYAVGVAANAPNPAVSPMAVTVTAVAVQWVLVLGVWLWLVVVEGREPRSP